MSAVGPENERGGRGAARTMLWSATNFATWAPRRRTHLLYALAAGLFTLQSMVYDGSSSPKIWFILVSGLVDDLGQGAGGGGGQDVQAGGALAGRGIALEAVGLEALDADAVPPGVHQQLVRVLSELVSNTARYAAPGGARLVVGTDGRSLRAVVSNAVPAAGPGASWGPRPARGRA